jgi:hypothetical protein
MASCLSVCCCSLKEDEATLTLVQRHLLRTTATEALDALLCWADLEFAEEDMAAAAATGEAAAPGSWTPATRSKLVRSLPSEVGQPLSAALDAAGGTDPQVGGFAGTVTGGHR